MKGFYDNVFQKIDEDKNGRNFFKHIGNLLGNSGKPRWSPKEMFPDSTDEEMADKLADYFNGISMECAPLNLSEIPTTNDRSLPVLAEQKVAEQMRYMRKPNSIVTGNLPTKLYKTYATQLAVPVTSICNKLLNRKYGPLSGR